MVQIGPEGQGAECACMVLKVLSKLACVNQKALECAQVSIAANFASMYM